MNPEHTEAGVAGEAEAQNPPTEDVCAETPSEENGLAQLQAENTELKEKVLRMAAESQNTRKRLVKQQQDAHKYRHQDILKDLADIIDNFERAIDSSTDSRDFDTFHEGVRMIEKQFSGMLTDRYNLERFGADGEPFDPAAHEAVMMEESSDVETASVKQVYQAGYRLHERVLRPAKVVVHIPAAGDSGGDEAASSEDTADEDQK